MTTPRMALPLAKPPTPAVAKALTASTSPFDRAEGEGLPSSPLTAPDRADELWWPTGGVEDMLDDAAVYATLHSHPDQAQRKLFERLIPVMGKARVLAASARGLEQGWLVESRGSRKARLLRTVETPDVDVRVVGLLVAALEQLQKAGVFLGHEHRHRLKLVARGVAAGKVIR